MNKLKEWMCRRGWHGWDTRVSFNPACWFRLAVHRRCVRCGAEEWQ
ncbi:hypothetical protein SEA_ABBYDAISY_64 [Arthrobacter phage AbbyDaisy]|nr:hypothetical protein SEA_ABBYDAISY_64 [Arthrobacter phage AbbyDaisy]